MFAPNKTMKKVTGRLASVAGQEKLWQAKWIIRRETEQTGLWGRLWFPWGEAELSPRWISVSICWSRHGSTSSGLAPASRGHSWRHLRSWENPRRFYISTVISDTYIGVMMFVWLSESVACTRNRTWIIVQVLFSGSWANDRQTDARSDRYSVITWCI